VSAVPNFLSITLREKYICC